MEVIGWRPSYHFHATKITMSEAILVPSLCELPKPTIFTIQYLINPSRLNANGLKSVVAPNKVCMLQDDATFWKYGSIFSQTTTPHITPDNKAVHEFGSWGSVYLNGGWEGYVSYKILSIKYSLVNFNYVTWLYDNSPESFGGGYSTLFSIYKTEWNATKQQREPTISLSEGSYVTLHSYLDNSDGVHSYIRSDEIYAGATRSFYKSNTPIAPDPTRLSVIIDFPVTMAISAEVINAWI